jgi:apolipoprotein N-acyltransferase
VKALLPAPGRRGLPTLSGVVLAAAFPPLHLIVPSFLGLVPLVLYLLRQGDGPGGEREAGKGGFLFGLVYFGLLLHWIALALLWYSLWAIPAYLTVVLILSWGTHWVCRLTHRLRSIPVPFWLIFGLAWTTLEWVRAHLPGELAFPWLGLGTSLTGYPELVGIAEVVGARGVTLWLAASSALLGEVVYRGLRGEIRPAVHRGVAWVVLVSLPMAWGIWRAATLPLVEVGLVSVAQPNIPEHLKLKTEEGIDSTFVSLERLIGRGEHEGTELFAWPEMTFLGWVETDPELRDRVRALTETVSVPVLYGGIGHGENPGGPPIPFNSAFLTSPDRAASFRYDKRRLVPMVERVPFVPPTWIGDDENYGAYGKGRELPLGQTSDGDRFGVLICYESTYPGLARAYRRAGARFLVNITNDAWFGRETWYSRTGALWQHPAHLVMRAIENRVGIVRAANTGPSFFVDPVGRIRDRTGLFEEEVRAAPVFTTDGLTLYARFGDWAGTASAFLLVALILLHHRTRARKAQDRRTR